MELKHNTDDAIAPLLRVTSCSGICGWRQSELHEGQNRSEFSWMTPVALVLDVRYIQLVTLAQEKGTGSELLWSSRVHNDVGIIAGVRS